MKSKGLKPVSEGSSFLERLSIAEGGLEDGPEDDEEDDTVVGFDLV